MFINIKGTRINTDDISWYDKRLHPACPSKEVVVIKVRDAKDEFIFFYATPYELERDLVGLDKACDAKDV